MKRSLLLFFLLVFCVNGYVWGQTNRTHKPPISGGGDVTQQDLTNAVAPKANKVITTGEQQFEGNHEFLGRIFLTQLATPVISQVENIGTAGSTTYGYKVVAKVGTQTTAASVEVQTTTGNATLDSNNFNRITWGVVTGATGYDVYRVTGGATQGLIGSTSNKNTTTFDDTGLSGSGSAPTVNTTGRLTLKDGTDLDTASETAAGVAEIATQSETDAGTDNTRVLTPAKLANYSLRGWTVKATQTITAVGNTIVISEGASKEVVVPITAASNFVLTTTPCLVSTGLSPGHRAQIYNVNTETVVTCPIGAQNFKLGGDGATGELDVLEVVWDGSAFVVVDYGTRHLEKTTAPKFGINDGSHCREVIGGIEWVTDCVGNAEPLGVQSLVFPVGQVFWEVAGGSAGEPGLALFEEENNPGVGTIIYSCNNDRFYQYVCAGVGDPTWNGTTLRCEPDCSTAGRVAVPRHYTHATDCTSVTGAVDGDTCWEKDDNQMYEYETNAWVCATCKTIKDACEFTFWGAMPDNFEITECSKNKARTITRVVCECYGTCTTAPIIKVNNGRDLGDDTLANAVTDAGGVTCVSGASINCGTSTGCDESLANTSLTASTPLTVINAQTSTSATTWVRVLVELDANY